jgi:septal ring factor EnvC (AmiA/AmiB activator)
MFLRTKNLDCSCALFAFARNETEIPWMQDELRKLARASEQLEKREEQQNEEEESLKSELAKLAEIDERRKVMFAGILLAAEPFN